MLRYDTTSPLLDQVCAVSDKILNGGIIELSTSGTTGNPKIVSVDVAKVVKQGRKGASSESWLLTYDPYRWAGVSVIMHVIRSSATLCVPNSLEFTDLLKAIQTLKPTHLSLTPSMFRNLVLRDSGQVLSTSTIRQITFGGEYATQSVLDLAKSIFPATRISHVYASTESGDICSVSDGLEGIPVRKFRNYKFDGDELIVDGRYTGDFWQLDGDRYYFLGRKEEIINVGGNKVSPIKIEEFAIRMGAKTAKAYAISNVLMGSLVGLQYTGELNSADLPKKFREVFPKYACPVLIEKVDNIELTMAGKVRRSK